MPENKLGISISPHIRDREDIPRIMKDVVVSLVPAMVASFMFFGWGALLRILASVVSCLAAEFLWVKALRKEITIGDGSAVVTGILLAFVLPPRIPAWIIVIGGAVAILIGKEIFGGLGHNPFNPALVGRAVLLASWPMHMTSWVRPLDAVSCATPLGIVKMGLNENLPSYMDMLVGNRAGCLGETSVLALLIGAGYLLYRKHISLHIPLTYVGTVFAVALIFKKDPLFNVMAGGLILGAFFMATDMVTSPLTGRGKMIFGTGCGLLTMLIRYEGGFPEGVCYSILIMNMVTPLIDRLTEQRPFGH